MSRDIEILDCAAPASIQDAGRPGYRHLGVPLSGALDPLWLRLANALVSNPPDAAVVEMRLAGPVLLAHGDCCIAIAGDVDARVIAGDETRAAAPWRSHRLNAGEKLRIAAVRSGVAYLAIAGGIDTPLQLGSRSSYLRAGLGQEIRPGARLKVGPDGTASMLRMAPCAGPDTRMLRIVPGPQRDHFADTAWTTLLEHEFEVSREADRMGLRLLGPPLAHANPSAADIISDAVAPGAIQVPGDGRPILLLADGQTVGGYPKIAAVIGADLRRLGHLLPGARVRFVESTLAEAIEARRQAARDEAELLASITPLRDEPDLHALYTANLIDGVIHADASD